MMEVVFSSIAASIHPNETGGPAWMLLEKGHLTGPSLCLSVCPLSEITADSYQCFNFGSNMIYALDLCITYSPSKPKRLLFGLWGCFTSVLKLFESKFLPDRRGIFLGSKQWPVGFNSKHEADADVGVEFKFICCYGMQTLWKIKKRWYNQWDISV